MPDANRVMFSPAVSPVRYSSGMSVIVSRLHSSYCLNAASDPRVTRTPARLVWPMRASTRAFAGGDERTRTADPLLAKQVLYQLSYVPVVDLGIALAP